jgi:uncharacterized membrane protein (DUF2068 family)
MEGERSAYAGGERYDLTPGYRPVTYGGRGAGSLLFAGTVLGLIGTFNVIAGVSGLAESRVISKNTVFAIGNVRLWGGIVLVAGVLELIASFAIFTRSAYARWFGVCVAAVNAITQLFYISANPAWAMAVFAADLFVIHALVVHGGKGLDGR